MADSAYHHSQRTRLTADEARALVGRRASLVLTGTVVEAREHPDVGPAILLEVDERYGFGPLRLGGDAELFDFADGWAQRADRERLIAQGYALAAGAALFVALLFVVWAWRGA